MTVRGLLNVEEESNMYRYLYAITRVELATYLTPQENDDKAKYKKLLTDVSLPLIYHTYLTIFYIIFHIPYYFAAVLNLPRLH